MAQQWIMEADDRTRLRELASKVRDIALSDVNQQRQAEWRRHNGLRPGRPVILAETGGLCQSRELSFEAQLRCRQPWARGMESQLVGQIYQFEQVGDDWAIEPFWNIGWQVMFSDYGVKVEHKTVKSEGHMGSFSFQPPLSNLREDFSKLQPRTFAVDRESTLAWKAHVESVIGDLLPTRMRGNPWWTLGLTIVAIDLIGLEQMMMYMFDDPEGLHRLMAFLRDDHIDMIQWYQRQGLLALTNGDDYIGSGSRGYCDCLPQADYQPGAPVRLKDIWALSESQETVGISPEMFEEFVFPYQQPIIEQVGLSYYGCCEPVHNRWHVVKRIKNLRKVSVSPWCDQAFMAKELKGKQTFCRKPNPTLISTENFDEAAILADLRNTIKVAGECNLELVMKDVHTLSGHADRLAKWVKLARQCIGEAGWDPGA